MKQLESTLQQIRPIDPEWIAAAARHQLVLTKPPGSLGRLEEVANRIAAIGESLAPTAARPRIVIFAADHGVCAEGVSPYPSEVTAQMVLNFLHGGAAICALTRTLGIDLKVCNAGVATSLPTDSGLIGPPVAQGTRNFCQEPAMSETELHQALALGIDAAADAAESGYDLLGFGEMGIGNTTSAAAITAALTGLSAEQTTGRGTGADDKCLRRKQSAVQRALQRHAPELHNPLGILRCLGGLEIAAMTGYCVSAAANRIPVVIDGFIATAAATIAVQLSPACAGYLLLAHRSTEPGHSALASRFDHEPLLDLNMRLGEGTGAALAIKIVQAAVAAFTQMATFAAAGVSNK